MDYVRAHLDDSLRLEQLAHRTHFSKYHFHRVFKATYGETVHEHVRRLRLEKALQLLATRQSLSILDIAVATGYSSQAAFTRDFKRHFRVTPGRARRYPGEANQLLAQSGVPGGAPEGLDGQVRIEHIQSRHLLYRTRHGTYDFRLGLAWIRLTLRARALGLINRDTEKLGIIFDDPDVTPAKRCRFDVCVSVEAPEPGESSAATKLFPAQTCATYEYSGDLARLGATLDAIYSRWLIQSSYEPADAPPFMLFDGPLHEYKRFRLCVPVDAGRRI